MWRSDQDSSRHPSPSELDFPFSVLDTDDCINLADAENNWWETHPDEAQLLEHLLGETSSSEPSIHDIPPAGIPANDKQVIFNLTHNRTVEVSRYIARDIEEPQSRTAPIDRAFAELDEAKAEISAATAFIKDRVTQNSHRGGSLTKHPEYPKILAVMDMAHTATKKCEDALALFTPAQESTHHCDAAILRARIAGASAAAATESAAAAKILITAFEHEQNSELHLISLRSITAVYRGLTKQLSFARSYTEQLTAALNSPKKQTEPATESANQSAYAAYKCSSMASDQLASLFKATSQLVSKHREIEFSHREIKEAHQKINRSHERIRSLKNDLKIISHRKTVDQNPQNNDLRYLESTNAIKASHSAAKQYKSILIKVDKSPISEDFAIKISQISKAAINIAETNARAGFILMAKITGNSHKLAKNLTQEHFMAQLHENMHHARQVFHQISSDYTITPDESKETASHAYNAAHTIFNSTTNMYASAKSTVEAAFNGTTR